MPNPSLFIALGAVTVNMMGVGLVSPILPRLVKELTGGGVAQVAVPYDATAIIFEIMQFVFSPILDTLSDRLGR